jgi:CheY-like chemotaxis protein
MALPVLVVEDHSINQEVAVLQLKALGMNVVVVSDGSAAVEAVRAGQFSLILMDVMIPVMDGCEAARRIREMEQMSGRRTPIVAVSAWSSTDNRRRCTQAGMDDYLDKPYDRAALKAVIDRWVTT